MNIHLLCSQGGEPACQPACDPNAVCLTVNGSGQCKCRNGFFGNGITCTGKNVSYFDDMAYIRHNLTKPLPCWKFKNPSWEVRFGLNVFSAKSNSKLGTPVNRPFAVIGHVTIVTFN